MPWKASSTHLGYGDPTNERCPRTDRLDLQSEGRALTSGPVGGPPNGIWGLTTM